MIDGEVNDALEPVIEIGLVGGERTAVIEAIVDTGFSGQLCLSKRYLAELDLAPKFVERYELANGEVIVEDVYGGTIAFDGQERDVDLILTDSQDTLVGAELLGEYELRINYVAKAVRIAKAS